MHAATHLRSAMSLQPVHDGVQAARQVFGLDRTGVAGVDDRVLGGASGAVFAPERRQAVPNLLRLFGQAPAQRVGAPDFPGIGPHGHRNQRPVPRKVRRKHQHVARPRVVVVEVLRVVVAEEPRPVGNVAPLPRPHGAQHERRRHHFVVELLELLVRP